MIITVDHKGKKRPIRMLWIKRKKDNLSFFLYVHHDRSIFFVQLARASHDNDDDSILPKMIFIQSPIHLLHAWMIKENKMNKWTIHKSYQSIQTHLLHIDSFIQIAFHHYHHQPEFNLFINPPTHKNKHTHNSTNVKKLIWMTIRILNWDRPTTTTKPMMFMMIEMKWIK